MFYILDDSGYIEETSSHFIECKNKTCTEYKGTIPSGYDSLDDWVLNANIRAYKIDSRGNLVFDSAKNTALQAEWANTENYKTITTSVTTNLGVGYYANQLRYKRIGNIVFCYLLINTKAASTVTDAFYVELPFTFDENWYFPMIKSNDWNDYGESYYLRPDAGTNKIYITKDHNRAKQACNALHSGYLIDCQFFAFVK
jgi:hypothetical protein